MGTVEIYFLLTLAGTALLGYLLVRRQRRLRVERMTRSLRRALESEGTIARAHALLLQRAS